MCIRDRGRVVSCTADATHFSNCEGSIVLKDNLFENQLDDATNIHGIYEKVERIVAPDKILTRLVHGQQFGFRTFKPGDKIELVRGKSMITYAENTIADVETINKEFKLLTLKDELPETAVAGDAVAVIRDYPEITITGNYIGKNRARGMLLNCRGKTLVENNVFHAPGAAILFEGDACFWFEQGGVSDCTIRGNVFENCKFSVWGGAVIDVAAGVREDLDKSRYNKNIVIENNTFKVFDDVPLLNIYCVDGLKWRGNKIEKTSDYPAREFSGGVYKVRDSDNVEIEE